MAKKIVDETLPIIQEQMLREAAEQRRMKPTLDRELHKIRKLDNKIAWFESKIKEVEKEKQEALNDIQGLLELAFTTSHKLDLKTETYTVKPDNRRKVEVEDTAKFLTWLKKNKDPTEVFEFFKDSLKLVNLKRFCESEFNNQRLEGVMEPSIDGIIYGEETFRRLKTETKEKRK